MIAHKYAEFGAARDLDDLAECHGRAVSKAFVQDVADAVAAVALAPEEGWEYELPEFAEPVATVTVGLDGTCMLMGKDTWRESMVGTLGFYNKQGERLHTVYAAATPEYGKLTFFERFDRELDWAKAACPQARYVGLADGAKGNWLYLDSVKQRLCGSGMRWQEAGAAAVLAVRCLTYTAGRWGQFWGRIDRDGFRVAA